MARVIKEIEIEGQPAMALFDTGATHTYIRSPLLADVPKRAIRKPYRVVLGGNPIEVRELCVALGKIEGLEFDAEAVPVDEIGWADGHELDALIGASTMEKWDIKIDTATQELDLEPLRRRESSEFWKLWRQWRDRLKHLTQRRHGAKKAGGKQGETAESRRSGGNSGPSQPLLCLVFCFSFALGARSLRLCDSAVVALAFSSYP